MENLIYDLWLSVRCVFPAPRHRPPSTMSSSIDSADISALDLYLSFLQQGAARQEVDQREGVGGRPAAPVYSKTNED